MKAAYINQYGPPDVLEYGEIEVPHLKADQLLVKVHATSVNPIDWKIRSGWLKLLTGSKFPLVLGFDVSGEVVAASNQAVRFQPGEAIYVRLDQLSGLTPKK